MANKKTWIILSMGSLSIQEEPGKAEPGSVNKYNVRHHQSMAGIKYLKGRIPCIVEGRLI